MNGYNLEAIAAQVEAHRQKYTLPPNDAVLDAQRALQIAQATADLASESFDGWIVKYESATRIAEELERSSSKSALAGTPLEALGADVAAAQASLRIAKETLDLAGQAREDALIALEEAKAEVIRRELAQAQERADSDFARFGQLLAELNARPGGLHVKIHVTRFVPEIEAQDRLLSIEADVRARKAKLQKVRGIQQ